MTIREIRDAEVDEFMRSLHCLECKSRVSYNGSGQAGIYRVVCYHCKDCDVIYQLITEKKGVLMFRESEKDGKCVLTADEAQNKCNVCACGLYQTPDQLGE